MDGDAKKIVWTVGAQFLALALGLLTVFLIVWAASKAWKKGQAESGYAGSDLGAGNWIDNPPRVMESNYNAPGYNDNWLGY